MPNEAKAALRRIRTDTPPPTEPWLALTAIAKDLVSCDVHDIDYTTRDASLTFDSGRLSDPKRHSSGFICSPERSFANGSEAVEGVQGQKERNRFGNCGVGTLSISP